MRLRLLATAVVCTLLAASTTDRSTAMTGGEGLMPDGAPSVPPLWLRLKPAIAGTAVHYGAPALAGWIVAARDEVAPQSRPIPGDMRERLAGFFPDALLDRVRFRIGWPEPPGWPSRMFAAADVRAVALDDVIVFRDPAIADDPAIWAHELTHVQQFTRWGVEGFAERYIRGHQEIETEAWEAAARYTMWVLEGRRARSANGDAAR